MRTAIAVLVASALLGSPEKGMAERIEWHLGGKNGADWRELTFLSVLMDTSTVAGSIQPFELKPDEDIVSQLVWTRYRTPIDLDYVVGKPRTWRAIGEVARPGNSTNPIEFIDGDRETHYSIKDWDGGGHIWGMWGEFYTLDFGTLIPAERFVWLPAEGVDPFSQEPYRPNYSLKRYELTGSNDVALVNQMEARTPAQVYYQPLDILLNSSDQSFAEVTNMDFSLHYLQFFRIRPIPGDNGRWPRFSAADFEVYGRGFVPHPRWVSTVIDLGQIVNIGQVHFGVSQWRKEDGGEPVPAPGAPTRVKVEIKTGLDDTPIAFQTYNDLQQQVEVSRSDYERLKPRVFPWDPPSVGWRGPIIDDQTNWSFWSSPVRQSGQRPRVPLGRYLQLQIQLETDELWAYARIDSLLIEASPLLADRVLGELARAEDLHPESQLVQAEPGERIELVCEIRAEFSGVGQSGFDAVRLLTPSASTFLELLMGDPLVPVEPDSLTIEANGFVVFLPQAVQQSSDDHFRVRFATALFGVADQINAEVFERAGDSLPQGVEGGDVSDEIGTNQLRIVAQSGSVSSVLGQLAIQPAVFTPQGDGINDQLAIDFTLFQILQDTQVAVDIYSLSGDRVRQMRVDEARSGRQQTVWDGRDDAGRTVPPGLYLVRINIKTDRGSNARVQPIAVAY